MGDAERRKGWLRLLIESVDVPLDTKDPHRLLFSTVQSLIPGAHGLYFRGGDGARKALSFDSTGCVNEPEDGWSHQDIFVHLAHGHGGRRSGLGCGGLPSGSTSPTGDSYSEATDRFERSVSLVQKMLAQTAVFNVPKPSSRKSLKVSTSSPEHSDNENSELVKRLTADKEQLIKEKETVNSEKETLQQEKELLQQRVADLEGQIDVERAERSTEVHHHEQNHADHNGTSSRNDIKFDLLTERIESTEARLEEAERMAECANQRADAAERSLKEESTIAERAMAEAQAAGGKVYAADQRANEADARSRQAISERDHLVEEKNRERERADRAEWSLGEHRTWLAEARGRIAEMERGLVDSHAEIDALRARAEQSEWSLGEHRAWLDESNRKATELEMSLDETNKERIEAAGTAQEEIERLREALKDKIHHEERIVLPEPLNIDEDAESESPASQDTVLDSGVAVDEEQIRLSTSHSMVVNIDASDETEMQDNSEDIEEVFEMRQIHHDDAEFVPSPPSMVDITEKEKRIAELEAELEEVRARMEHQVDDRFAQISQKADEAIKELEAARKRLEDEAAYRALEVNNKIQELTDKEEELNNLHNLIDELRDKLRELETARCDAEWHLGEHRDWLKNERDKVTVLEEQLRRANGEGTSTSRPVSRKNSTESGFGSINSAVENGRAGSESPPAVPPKVKFSSSALPDDLALEMMALSKAKQRMAEEIRELKTRVDPGVVEGERRAAGEQIRAANERCARLEQETAHFKDIAARVNMDTFNAQAGTIAGLEKARSDLEWKLGEHVQALNDARWRMGELESELVRVRASSASVEVVQEKEHALKDAINAKAHAEWQVGEVTRACNDAKWRVGELEAQLRNGGGGSGEEVARLREEKDHATSRADRLQRENDDQKWRIGELESGYAHHEWLLTQRVSHEEANGLRSRISELEGHLTGAHASENNLRWKIGELEEAVRRASTSAVSSEEANRLRAEKDALVAEKTHLQHRVEQLQKEWDDQKWRIGELESGYAHHEWLLSQKDQQPAGSSTEEVKNLQAEKTELLQRCEQLQADWHTHKWRIGELESGYAHHEWLLSQRPPMNDSEAMNRNRELEWKLGEARQEMEALRTRIAEVESELRVMREARDAERPGQLEENMRALRADKEALEKRCAELDKAFNDTKWRCGELDAALAHQRWVTDEERAKVARYQGLSNTDLDSTSNRDGSFIIKHRRPGDARMWQLAPKTSSDDASDLRPVTFIIDEPAATDAVFVIGGFSAWECCARLSRSGDSGSRRTATLHLPRGRHEFRFIVEGGWSNSSEYPTVPNPFGTANNWITVE